MEQLKEAKRKYDKIQIPDELADRVQKAINRSDAKRKQQEKMEKRKSKGRYLKWGAGTAAAAVLMFSVLLNTNTAFAEGMSEIPVIGAVARVLTFRSYEKEEEDMKLSVDIPSIEIIAADTNGLADSVNQEIHALCEAYAEDAVKRAEEYRQAFLDTGGTEEEWAEHQIEIKVWYEINSQTEQYLSFAVMGSESWNSSNSETKYYNIDTANGTLVTLKDVLGEDYIRIANDSIQSQMKQKSEETGIAFWSAEEGGFTGITDGTHFYMNQAGNPVIVFEKYEIAPGAAGRPEFEITR